MLRRLKNLFKRLKKSPEIRVPQERQKVFKKRKFEDNLDAAFFLEQHKVSSEINDRLKELYEDPRFDNVDFYPREMIMYSVIYFTLKKLFKGNLKGKKIIHLAGGPGGFMKVLHDIEKADSKVLDISKKSKQMAEELGFGDRFIQKRAEDTGLDDNSVDVVFEDNFLDPYYVKARKLDVEKIFGEIRRILRPGGFFILQEGYHSINKFSDAQEEIRTELAIRNYERFGFELVEHIYREKPHNCLVLKKI